MKISDPCRAGFDPKSTAEIAPSMKDLFTFLPDPSLQASAEFRISLCSMPFLADHAFQDMVVLPGSFYIEMALSVYHELSTHPSAVIRNVTFQNPVVLSLLDTIIRIEVRNHGADTAEYSFYEAAAGNEGTPTRGQYAARLEIEHIPSALQESIDQSFSIEAFQMQADEVIGSDRFYKELRDNGNQYGASFRCVSSVWRAGAKCIGRLSSPHAESWTQGVRPTLLDSMTQMLAAFMMARGRTFVLRSIERIEIANLNFPNTLWCHATLRPQIEGESNRVVGDVRVFDPLGKMCLQLSGVTFVLLDRHTAPEEVMATKLVVASNFTAEPLEDSLKFWAAHFNLQTNIEFAPYDQIFQQLLQTESAFRRNSAGVNIILLQLEKWAAAERAGVPDFDKKRAEQCFGKRKTCILPNGLEIVHLNHYETDYLYREIFEDECYLK
jgi:acyl transferase domain-containing protein